MSCIEPASAHHVEAGVEMKVISELEGYGFSDSFVVDSIKGNKHNHASTCYHLLLSSHCA